MNINPQENINVTIVEPIIKKEKKKSIKFQERPPTKYFQLLYVRLKPAAFQTNYKI